MSFITLLTMLIPHITLTHCQTSIPMDSMDYWVRPISPRCVVNIIYLQGTTNTFFFESSHGIPVVFIPLENTARELYFANHKFSKIPVNQLKAECFFGIIHYKRPLKSPNKKQGGFFIPRDRDGDILRPILEHIAYRNKEPKVYLSSVSFTLLLYYGDEFDEPGFKQNLDLSSLTELALIHMTEPSRKNGYSVWCKQNGTFAITLQSVTMSNSLSVVNQEFFNYCLVQSHVFISDIRNSGTGPSFSSANIPEHEIIRDILHHANATLANTRFGSSGRYTVPEIFVNHNRYSPGYFQVFDNSIKLFTCYKFPILSFEFYISAFPINIWISIGLSGCLLAAFLNLHIHFNLPQSSSFSSLLYYFSIFVEES